VSERERQRERIGLDPDYRLSDRYAAGAGTVFMTGIQALARLPLEQLRADRAAGLNTAAFVSGYPGSPLAGYDGAIAAAVREAPDLPIVLRPALNEEYAATAVMGSQLTACSACGMASRPGWIARATHCGTPCTPEAIHGVVQWR
jgi:hypothetical protein